MIHDFEPFFCPIETCSSPFSCANTHSGWVAHLTSEHSQPTWLCWHCRSDAGASFPSAQDLDEHLKQLHIHEVSDEQRPALVESNIIKEQYLLQSCPFCGGFPEDIEKQFPNRKSSQAQDSLIVHLKDHLISVALMLLPVRAEVSEDFNVTDEDNGIDKNEIGSRNESHNDRIHDFYNENEENVSDFLISTSPSLPEQLPG